jgi:hypothetical protein
MVNPDKKTVPIGLSYPVKTSLGLDFARSDRILWCSQHVGLVLRAYQPVRVGFAGGLGHPKVVGMEM